LSTNLHHVTIIAGPNGSGKTTFAKKYLQLAEQPFLNADEIAKEISPDHVDKVQLSAGKEYFKRLHSLIEQKSHLFLRAPYLDMAPLKLLNDYERLDLLLV
jgi:predicted ABC-type ATPase